MTIGAVVVVLALIGGITAVIVSRQSEKHDEAVAAEPWTPKADNMDPSTKIEGIYVGQSVTQNNAITYPKYRAALHIGSTQRVAYDRFPPVGGPHDGTWAACNGVVYTKAVRDENMVHTLEHGAIWIAYNPDTLPAADVDKLKTYVTGKTYISMSPYPGLDQPISLQAWGHQLKVTSADDPRINEFIIALQQNPYTTPEPNGTCSQPTITADNPPAFDPSPRDSTATPLDGSGLVADTTEAMGVPAGEATDSGSVSVEPSGSTGADASGSSAAGESTPASATAASTP